MYVTLHSNVTDRAVLDSLWDLYAAAYEPLSATDASREILFRHEFDEVLADPTYRTTVVRDDAGSPIAMSVSATDIGATRYLSRAYFERLYPERMAAGQVHYMMWAVVHPDHQGGRALFELSRAGLGREAEDGALLVFDLPETNQPDAEGGAAELIYRMAQMVAEVSLETYGVTRYYALDFAQPAAADDTTAPAAADADSAIEGART